MGKHLNTLHPVKHRQYIIERVFERGTWNDLKELSGFYTRRQIKHALKNARWMDEKNHVFCKCLLQYTVRENEMLHTKTVEPGTLDVIKALFKKHYFPYKWDNIKKAIVKETMKIKL